MFSAGIIKPVEWNGVEKKEIQIPVRDGTSIRAVVYRPENAEPGPLCVYFHGGGWTFGWPESWEYGFEVLTKQLGITVVGVAYRLSPEHVFPTAAQDACDALEWCAENAGTLGADAKKGVIVAGTSAGANVAAVAAHDAVEKRLKPAVTGVVLLSATLVHQDAVFEEHRKHYKSREEHKDALLLDVRGMDWFSGESLEGRNNEAELMVMQGSTNLTRLRLWPVRSIGQEAIRANRQRTSKSWGERGIPMIPTQYTADGSTGWIRCAMIRLSTSIFYAKSLVCLQSSMCMLECLTLLPTFSQCCHSRVRHWKT